MAWESLRTKLSGKPRLLAGPVLRKVTPDEVSVWLALRLPAKVELTILNTDGQAVMNIGQGRTTAIGTHLHVIVITARRKSSEPQLGPGVIYQYNLTFDFGTNQTYTLDGVAGPNATLCYAPFQRPTFCLPPYDPTTLRLFQGSCRMPHGQGRDALWLLDPIIRDTAQNADVRPHQLLLTGDQIYADDVALSLLVMLSDASDVLLGWTEKLPVHPNYQVPCPPLPAAYVRSVLATGSGLTTVDHRAHLMSLGEYIAMYLFAWSDVLWDPNDLPTFADVTAPLDRISHYWRFLHKPNTGEELEIKEASVDIENKRLKEFKSTLSNVRRVLANIPSYMIFDDHEVTDDWNMTFPSWQRIYKDDLGMRICQNALTAYALCQHWGNVPDDFSGANPGAKILGLLDGGDETKYEQNVPELRKLVGLYEGSKFASSKSAGHESGSLIYNYTVEGACHQVIFTDSRSWRTFPGKGRATLLSPSQIKKQIVDTPDAKGRILFLVLSTNAPPMRAIRTATEKDYIANRFEHFPDVYESWEMETKSIDRLFKAISDKLPLVGGKRKGRAILLSGDVHMSFASRLLFRATARIEDPPASPQPVEAVIAQLVCSGFKRQNADTVRFDREGYNRRNLSERIFVPSRRAEGYAGWNAPANSKEHVAHTRPEPSVGGPPIYLDGPGSYECNDPDEPIEYVRIPDYGYRLDYLTPSGESIYLRDMTAVPAIPVGSTPQKRREAIDAYNKAAENYRTYNNTTPKEVVGVNSVGEISFDRMTNGELEVHHTLRWMSEVSTALYFTTYTVSLFFNPVTDEFGFNQVQPAKYEYEGP